MSNQDSIQADESSVQLWRTLRTTTALMGAELRATFAQWNITGAQWGALRVVAESDPEGVILTEISQRLRVSCANVTGTIDRLEEAGLIKRTVHADDRRAILATLTENGRKVYEQLVPVYRRKVADLLSVVPPKERELLMKVLSRISDHVEQMSGAE